MKKVLGITIILAALCGVAGEYFTRAMGTSGVSVTNDQRNASWDLAAILIQYQKLATEDARIVRTSGGASYVLAVVPQGATNVLWTVQQPVPFRFGDILTITSGGGTGTVQIITR